MFRPLVSARRPDCNFMMEYMVKDHDSLERIAAFHDCTVGELMKMNKMGSRMVFPGQKLMVPSPASDDIFEERRKESDSGGDQGGVEAFGEATSSVPCDERVVGSFSAGSSSKHHTLPGADGIRMGPGSAVLVQQRSLSTSSEKAPSMPLSRSKKTRSQETEQDTDCLQRFLKIKVKQVTESDGTVSGTLLVTPNALMFDPDVMHPLVIENGQDLYMMMAHMDEIMSVAVYKDIGALTGETDKVEKMYDPEHVRTPSIDDALSPSTAEDEGESGKGNVNESKFTSDDAEKPAERCAGDSSDANGNSDIRDESIVTRTGLSKLSESESALPQIAEEEQKALGQEAANQLTSSATPPEVDTINDVSSASETVGEHKAPLQAVDARAHSIKGSVTSGAGNFTQTAVSGTKSVAHEVVTHTRSAAGTLQTGIQTSAKMAATHAKVAVDAVASVPQGIVTMGSGILEGLQQTTADTSSSKEIRTEASLRREKSLATLEVLKHKTQLAREQAYREKNTALFSCATSAEEKPELFRPVHELLAHRASSADTQQPSTELPYYMIVKLNRKRKFTRSKTLRSSSSVVTSSASFDEEPVGNRVRRQFWFAIPRHRAESIYHFLLQWSPEKYGQEASISASEEATSDNSNTASGYQFGENAFIVLDSETDDKLAGEKPATPVFGTSYLNREWEIVTVQEMCRRLSLDRLDQMVMPIPDGATSSQILDQSMIRQIMEILPVRAEGYPWVNIYSSEKHGFSLSTFYRKMMEWDEEMSPILLIIRDCEENVFGAIASTRLLPSEHFFGTGDSCLLFKFVTDPDTNEKELHSFAWTGDNQYFVKASKDSLSMGAGGGHYGLWLDADLNHGRSLRCQTFDNEPLAGDREDFNIQFLEAFGFRML